MRSKVFGFIGVLLASFVLGVPWSRAGIGGLAEEQEIQQATAAWVEAYNARDAGRIAALYAPEATFWGTRSDSLRITPQQIAAYFEESVANPTLRVKIEQQSVRVYGDVAFNAGTYTVSDRKDGQEVQTPGRFSLVFNKRNGQWLIVHHHSSRMPPK